MLLYLANILDQLDLALDHLKKGDPNNARFALMLTDNAVELVLHQIAKDMNNNIRQFAHLRETFTQNAALEKALGRAFDDKVKFARLMNQLQDDVSESFRLFHWFRNDVYHVGLQHESVLRALGAFYIRIGCDFLSRYEPPYVSWGSYQKLPERAKKYFTGHDSFPGSKEQYKAACDAIGAQSGHDPRQFAEELADHTSEVVEDQDASIDSISTGAPVESSRDQVVIDCQIWSLPFSEEGQSFAKQKGWPGGTHFAFIEWLTKNYPLKFPRDPVPGWRKRVDRLRQQSNPHAALKMYRTFMDQTADIRERIDQTAQQVGEYIDGQIEHALLERAKSRRDS